MMNKTDKNLSTYGFDNPDYNERAHSIQGILFVPTQFGEHSFIFHLLYIQPPNTQPRLGMNYIPSTPSRDLRLSELVRPNI